MAYQTPIDIANMAVAQCGDYHMNSFQEVTDAAIQASNCYDNERAQELERHGWRFAIRRARVRAVTSTTQLVTFPEWDADTEYTLGQVVLYAGGTYLNATVYPWILNAPSNTGGQPDITPQWGHYFGTLTADIFDSQTLYDAGELTIVPEVWLGGQDYVQYNIVTSPDNSTFYVALQTVSGSNTDPSLDPTNWQAWVQPENQTFGPDGPLFPDYVTFTDLNGGPLIYISLQGNNGPQSSTDVIGLPATQPLAWTNIPGCSLEQLRIIWPTDAGPANDPQTQNVFWLPFGFLRPCAADPKADRVTWLGAPTGPYPNDYVFEGQYMLSRSPYPITLRFVADIADVTRMNPLFCKTVAMNMAELMSTPLKASEVQMQRIERQKKIAVREAREVDAIFQEAVAPELDDFITARY